MSDDVIRRFLDGESIPELQSAAVTSWDAIDAIRTALRDALAKVARLERIEAKARELDVHGDCVCVSCATARSILAAAGRYVAAPVERKTIRAAVAGAKCYPPWADDDGELVLHGEPRPIDSITDAIMALLAGTGEK